MKTLIIIFSLFIISDLYSQDYDCQPCPDVPYNPTDPPYEYEYTTTTPLGIITVFYQTRICNEINEVKILRIEFDPNNEMLNDKDLYYLGLDVLLNDNPMLFPPWPGDESYTWQIYSFACWKSLPPTDGIYTLIPCNDDCCITTKFVHFSQDCDTRIFDGIKRIGSVDCDDLVDPDCINICDPE
ncbi:MAG: hypothetical protein BAJALOKI1v1_1640003 [Promethearchaeota archaeon]|nr:MAG: hypothetical protein BAJALOKI1v1_1640003 [Candidatus Lokiarchaeota archaeon]